ncbi:MAG: hypothetical protein H0W36_04925 [Gemmatimonadetes bacterium]|nr:hypothetical protein [Gemmatimonadota bacterium]
MPQPKEISMRALASLFAGILYTASLATLLLLATAPTGPRPTVEIGPVLVIAVETAEVALETENPRSEREIS